VLRNRLSAAILPIVAMIAGTAYAGNVPVDFGTTELGQVQTRCFLVCFGENCTTSGRIDDLNVSPPFFVRGIRRGQFADRNEVCDNMPGLTTPTTLPRTLNPGQILVFDVDLVPTQDGPVDRVLTIDSVPPANTGFDFSAFVAPVTSCTPSPTATCLTDDRFKVRTKWRTQFGTRNAGNVVPFGSDDSGMFYFFNPNNWEMLLKVLNACDLNPPRFWVFSAATTNVEFTLTVTDTETQQVKTYFNPLGNPAQPIQDTSAFATCP
jgi:hypothetical protein